MRHFIFLLIFIHSTNYSLNKTQNYNVWVTQHHFKQETHTSYASPLLIPIVTCLLMTLWNMMTVPFFLSAWAIGEDHPTKCSSKKLCFFSKLFHLQTFKFCVILRKLIHNRLFQCYVWFNVQIYTHVVPFIGVVVIQYIH